MKGTPNPIMTLGFQNNRQPSYTKLGQIKMSNLRTSYWKLACDSWNKVFHSKDVVKNSSEEQK